MDTTTEVVPVAEAPSDVLAVIAAAAADPRVEPAKLQALLDLKLRVDAIAAERDFNAAFARLQVKLPRIAKNGTIDLGKGKPIPFARWEDVDRAIRPLLAEEGFALSFTSAAVENGVVLTVILTHSAGHAKTSEMRLPPDAGPGRNALQALGSSRSYGKRYLACDMLNIVTEGQDDDGKKACPLSDDELSNVRNMLEACHITGPRLKSFLEFADAPQVELIQRHRYPDVMAVLRKELKKQERK
jgi:hypothetical protein